MRNFWKKIIIENILEEKAPQHEYSALELARGYRELKINVFRWIKDIVLIGIGITSAAFGLEGFLIPNKFIDGGATGISLLIHETKGVPLYLLIILINIPFVYLGFKLISKQFAIKTAIAITGLAIMVGLVHFQKATDDKLLVAVFGGFFLGAGIGLSVRGGAVIDGTEVLAIYLSRRFGTTIGDIIIGINIIVFSIAAYVLSIDAALYSLITYLAASKTLDFVIEGIEEYTGVTIISSHNEEIREMIIHELGRGVTVYKGRKGYGKTGETSDVDIVYTIITRLELNKLNTEIMKIDPNAFVVMSAVKDTKGGIIKKRRHKH